MGLRDWVATTLVRTGLRIKQHEFHPPPSQIGLAFGVGDEAAPLVTDSTLPTAYEGNLWAYVGVMRIAEAVAEIPLTVSVKRGSEWEPAPEHPLAVLLDYVNPRADSYMLKEATSSWLRLDGNAYWLKARAGKREPPALLYWLPSDRVRVKKKESPPYVAGYNYKVSDRETKFYPEEEVVHFRTFSRDPFYGQGNLKALTSHVNRDTYLADHDEGYLRRGGMPTGMLRADAPLDPESPEGKLMQAWWERITGRGQFGKPPIVGKDMDWLKIGAGIDEALAEKVPRFLREGILAGIGVPPGMAGILEYANYANLTQQERQFYRQGVIPCIRRIVAGINEQLAPEWGDDVRVDADLGELLALLADKDVGLKELAAGALTINEYRRDYANRDEVPWGNDWYGPFSTGLIASMEEGEEPVSTEPPGTVEPEDAEEEEEETPEPAEAAAALPARRRAMRRLSPQARVLRHKVFNNLRREQERKLTKVQAPWYEWATQEVLDRLDAAEKVTPSMRVRAPSTTSLLFDLAEGAKSLQAIMNPAFEDVYELAGVDAIASVGADVAFDITTPRARELLAERTREMASVAESAQKKLRTSLADGLGEGETVEQLRQRVLQWSRLGKEKYAVTVARTETAIVMNGATLEGFQQASATHKEWLAILDNDTREDHADLDGTVIPLSDSFDVGGERASGPGDPALSAEQVINCRCALAAAYEE